MKNKSILIVLICIAAAVTGILLYTKNTSPLKKVAISADYPYYDTLESLTDKADTIIKGKVIDYTYSELDVSEKVQSDKDQLNPGGETDDSTTPYTIYTVEIEKTYKGNVKEKDIMQIKQLGGISGNVEYVIEGAAKLEIGKKYVFFLETYSDSPASLLNPIQASYEYDDHDNIISNTQNDQNVQNDIQFKMEDLEKLLNSN